MANEGDLLATLLKIIIWEKSSCLSKEKAVWSFMGWSKLLITRIISYKFCIEWRDGKQIISWNEIICIVR